MTKSNSDACRLPFYSYKCHAELPQLCSIIVAMTMASETVCSAEQARADRRAVRVDHGLPVI